MSEIVFIVIGLISLPMFLSLQRYAVAYGYEGLSKKEALQQAKFAAYVGVILTMIGFLLLI